ARASAGRAAAHLAHSRPTELTCPCTGAARRTATPTATRAHAPAAAALRRGDARAEHHHAGRECGLQPWLPHHCGLPFSLRFRWPEPVRRRAHRAGAGPTTETWEVAARLIRRGGNAPDSNVIVAGRSAIPPRKYCL